MAQSKDIKSHSTEWWQEKFREIEAYRNDSNKKATEEIAMFFLLCFDEIMDKYLAFSVRYPELADALRPLTAQERRTLTNSLRQATKELADTGVTIADSLDATLATNPLQAMQLEVRAKLAKLYGEIEEEILLVLFDQYLDSYYRSAHTIFYGLGKGKKLTPKDRDELEAFLITAWRNDDSNWKDDLLSHLYNLTADIEAILLQSVYASLPYSDVEENVNKRMNRSSVLSAGVLRTNSDYYGTESQKDIFDELGLGQVIYTAVLDERTSEMCRAMDGTVLNVEDLVPWQNSPPLHMNCRSTLTPYLEDLPDYILEDDGLYSEIEKDFQEWCDKYVADSWSL